MMEERISDSIASSKTQQTSDKHRNDLPLIQFQIKQENPQPIPELEETIIKEIEIGESISAVHDGTIQDLGEIVPEIILNEADHNLNISAEGDAPGKWSHNDTVAFLEVLNDVLDTQEEAGGFLSRKNLFSRVTTILNDQGKNVTRAEIEKKYNNMLMTYRRCQQRLLKKGQTPFWPYFKVMSEIRVKQEGRERSLWDFFSKHLTAAGENPDRPGWAKRTSPFDSLLVSYPFVSAVPEVVGTSIPDCLTREWQRKRAAQEEHKISLVENLLSDWECQREVRREERRKLNETMARENSELRCLRQELSKGRLHIGKELRYLSQDVACLTSAVKSVRSMK